MAEFGFANFTVKWSLIVPEKSPPSPIKKDEHFRGDINGPGSPFSRRTKFEGNSFRTKLFIKEMVFDVIGNISIVSKQNFEFAARGEVDFVETILWGIARIIFTPLIYYVGSYMTLYLITSAIVRGAEGDFVISPGIDNFIKLHEISPSWIAGLVASILAALWLIYEVVKLIVRVSSTRAISKEAAQEVETWLGRKEQGLRAL